MAKRVERIPGYAIFRAGYWLVAPTRFLAQLEAKPHETVESVTVLREIKDEQPVNS